MVTNGKGINSVSKVSTSGLVDTYRIAFNDGTSSTFTVTNGEKGDKGDNQYVWIKYASKKPTATSHSFGDVADDWIGIYSGSSDTAPTDWTQYEWFKIKGEQGDTGEPATLVSSSVTYQVGDSGTIIPSGSWSESIPPVSQGKYLWTKEVTQFNTGNPITKYSVSRFGIDGTGSVSTVAGISPDAAGNVPLTAEDVNALPIGGGTMGGSINMNGQSLYGLNTPTKNDEAATKGYADKIKNDTETYVNNAVRTAAPRDLLDNSYFVNPVNQRGATHYQGNVYTIDRWVVWSSDNTGSVNIDDGGLVIDVGTSTTTVIEQYFEKGTLNAKKYTLAWLTSDNVLHINNSPVAELETKDRVHIEANAWTKIIWVALYEGEYTAETLPVYQPKGYGVELDECKRYFIRTNLYAAGVMNSPSSALIGLQNTYNMRIAPTIVINPFVGTITFSKSPAKSAAEIVSGYVMVNKTILNIQFNANVAEIWETVYVIFGAVDYSADL